MRRNSVFLCLSFLILSLSITALNWSEIAHSTFEVGDFAANSVLIQKAKHFNLLVGNYSRLGFNHPGPALLYMLATGEVVFHDALHLVSPIGGQLIAAAVYTALWITLIGYLFFHFNRNIVETLLFVCVACAVLAFSTPGSFNGLWFPHLYVLPFAAYTLAIGLFIVGERAALLPLGLACGALINGHVSFLFTTGVMALGAIGAHVVMAKLRPREIVPWSRLMSSDGSGDHRSAILAILAFTALMSPFVAKTVKNFPGPIADYIHYGGEHEANSWADSIRYVVTYWNTSAAVALLIMTICALSLFLIKDRSRPAILGALLLSTIATLLYTKFGVDDLSYDYVCLFYYSCPAFAFAIAAVGLSRATAALWRRILVPVISATCAVFCAFVIARPADSAGAFSDSQIPILFEKFKVLAPSKAVLDLDDGGNWGQVWSVIVGLEVYSERQHFPQPFCIERNWHILFTRDMKCTAQDLDRGRRLIVSAMDNPSPSADTALVALDAIKINEQPQTCLKPGGGRYVADDPSAFAQEVLGSGWTPGGPQYAWSQGNEAHLQICLSAEAKTLRLDLGAYIPTPTSTQTGTVELGGRDVGYFSFASPNGRDQVTVDLPAGSGERHVDVTIHIAHPISPRSVGASDDPRLLGVSIYGMSAG